MSEVLWIWVIGILLILVAVNVYIRERIDDSKDKEPFTHYQYMIYLEYVERLKELSWWQLIERRKLNLWLRDKSWANKFNQ